VTPSPAKQDEGVTVHPKDTGDVIAVLAWYGSQSAPGLLGKFGKAVPACLAPEACMGEHGPADSGTISYELAACMHLSTL